MRPPGGDEHADYWWAQGALDEATERRIRRRDLRELVNYIEAVDDAVEGGIIQAEEALPMVGAVFFPSPARRLRHELGVRLRLVRRR